MVEQKELCEDTEFNVTEYDPMSTFYGDDDNVKSRTDRDSFGQSSTTISFIGIRKNSVPVFKTKTMRQSVFNYVKKEVVYTQNDSVVEPSIVMVNTKPKPNLDKFVSKVGKKPSVQVCRKDYIDNKSDDRVENDAVNFSSDDSYILSQKSKNVEVSFDSDENEIHKVHMLQSLQALQYLNTIEIPSLKVLKDKMVFLPKKKNKKKTLIFDMDETLIHWVDSIEDDNPQFIIKVPIDGEEVEAGINVRPYALEWLEAVNQRFEVIVFTASHQTYADAVLDFLDPDHELIKRRLYRDSCYETEEGVYIKDLRIFANRKLEDLIIVDNAVYSFGFQLNNGIPIIPFYEDPNDEELFHLVPFLEILADWPDIRDKNKEAFQLEQMANDELGEFNRIWELSQIIRPEDAYNTNNYESQD